MFVRLTSLESFIHSRNITYDPLYTTILVKYFLGLQSLVSAMSMGAEYINIFEGVTQTTSLLL